MAGRTPTLFGYIEKLQGSGPWGRLLDAGTGPGSLRWITRLATTRWTAVTASESMAAQVRKASQGRLRKHDRIVVGNWRNPDLLRGLSFDTVLMDYFLGAIEGYAPYWQAQVFDRFRPLVAGRLYLVGAEPYVPFPSTDESSRMVREIGCLRDACLLLAGERPYREYPSAWVVHQLAQAGFRILDCQSFPIIYRAHFIDSQLDLCLRLAKRLAATELRDALMARIGQLRQHALTLAEANDGLRCGADYVITAQPAS